MLHAQYNEISVFSDPRCNKGINKTTISKLKYYH